MRYIAAMDFTIRFARSNDAPVLLRFIQALADYEKEPDAVEVDAATLSRQIEQDPPPFECLLAERGDDAVGFALFFGTYSTWRGKPGLYLEDLFVPPELRGQGIGKALLCQLARIAVDRGCGRLEWAVLDWNRPAIGFYEKLGAPPMPEWRTCRLSRDALAAAADGMAPIGQSQ